MPDSSLFTRVRGRGILQNSCLAHYPKFPSMRFSEARSFWRKVTLRELVSIIFQAHLATEETVDEYEVDRREHHTDAPPHEAYGEPVGGAGGVVDGQAVLRLHGGQDVGVDGEGGGGHHARDVGAGGEEGGPVAPPEAEVPHEDKARDGERRKDESPRALGE